MRRILITGGAGFIGSNLVKELYKENEITVIDDLSMGKLANIEKFSEVKFYKKSVMDYEFMKNLLIKEDFHYIFHLAAVASVADSIKRPRETHEVNFDSIFNILEVLRGMEHRSLKRLVFASSAAVYGNEVSLPKKENSTISPLSPYAIDKFASEKYVLTYNNLFDIPTSAVRFFNVYGPNQNPSSQYSGVISIIIDKFNKRLSGDNVEFNLFGDGSQTRDFIYIDDVINAILIVAKSEESLGKVFNVGTGKETNLNVLLEIVSNLLNIDLQINRLESRSGDIPKSFAEIKEIKKLGFECKYSIEEGLKEYLKKLNMIN